MGELKTEMVAAAKRIAGLVVKPRNKLTQLQALERWFDAGKTLTVIEAWHYLQIPNLRSRLPELKAKGYPLDWKWEVEKANSWGQRSRYKRYFKSKAK